jgi:EpsI family protein
MNFLRSGVTRVLSLVLALQALVFYTAVSRAEYIPVVRPLAEFPTVLEGWRTVQDVPIEPEELEILKADDTLNRVYANSAANTETSLFIAYFKTQRAGQSPHSPKNCLPGNGWEPLATGTVSIPVTGRTEPIVANRYVTAHGDQRSVTIYWYQSHQRIIASEYKAKFWLVADSIRYRRSDTALVKIVIPVINNDADRATDIGIRFVQAIFPSIQRQLPA